MIARARRCDSGTAGDADRARAGLDQADQHAAEGGLAAALSPTEAQHLPGHTDSETPSTRAPLAART
jgi:hypothetical protein